MSTDNVPSVHSKQEPKGESWCTLPPEVPISLIGAVEASALNRLRIEAISDQDVKNIQNRQLDLIPKDLCVSDERLEKLRRLCQLWEVDIHLQEIKSHRKFIGPVIVAAKKMIFPMIRFMLKDLIREQRDFNAASIRLFADLCNQSSSKKE